MPSVKGLKRSLSILPIRCHRASIYSFRQTSVSTDSKSRIRFEIKLFNGKDGYDGYFSKNDIHRSFPPHFTFPLRGGRGTGRGGRGEVIYIVEGVTGKPGILPVSAGWWSWIILSCVKYLQTGLQDVGCKTLMPLGISPPVHTVSWIKPKKYFRHPGYVTEMSC